MTEPRTEAGRAYLAEYGSVERRKAILAIEREAWMQGIKATQSEREAIGSQCDGAILEQAIRNLRREQLAKGWTGNLSDGWTIAGEYNRLTSDQ